MKSYIITLLFCLTMCRVFAQTGKLSGTISTQKSPIVANIKISKLGLATSSDANGKYSINEIPTGVYNVTVTAVGYKSSTQKLSIAAGEQKVLDVNLSEDRLNIEDVVVSGTRYDISRRESPVVVNVIGQRLFNATQSVALSETLNYQPGLRLETNCQNCGFTQVRLNGLEGSYSQILMNSRPIFSALNGVYGLDQIPTSMIDQIEVVRGGGSALYGSNAIAGTINIITKDPVENTWEINNNAALIDGKKIDNNLSFNASIVSDDLSNGVTFYGARRNRQAYDANEDGFTEITKLTSNTFGAKAFYKLTERNKLTFDFSAIKEQRRGGDRLDLAPHFTDITEQLDHNTFMGGITFDQYSVDFKTKYSVYASGQYTHRDSYYGGLGGGREHLDSVLAANAYGITKDIAFVGGGQLTHTFNNSDILTGGMEYNYSNVDDQTAGYNRVIDQTAHSTGLYAQYEWKMAERFKALLGIRFDHIKVNGAYALGSIERASDLSVSALSPRITLLYDLADRTVQLRAGYARGFRAPQAFNEDLHVSSVGGEQQFILIGDGLETEYSNAYTASVNYTGVHGSTQTSVLVEGFYTDLENPFTYVSAGQIGDNLRLEQMVNGSGTYVTGANIELGVALSDRLSFQLGGTIQKSRYRQEQELFEGEDKTGGDPAVLTKQLVRAPNGYGYFNGNWKATKDFSIDITGVYTGSMIAPHVVRESGFMDLVQTKEFYELNLKLAHVFSPSGSFAFELSGGVQNMFNSYQNDFDSGAGRDSDFIYGPTRPRTFFLGIKIGRF